jgi:hypothetical protein
MGRRDTFSARWNRVEALKVSEGHHHSSVPRAVRIRDREDERKPPWSCNKRAIERV